MLSVIMLNVVRQRVVEPTHPSLIFVGNVTNPPIYFAVKLITVLKKIIAETSGYNIAFFQKIASRVMQPNILKGYISPLW